MFFFTAYAKAPFEIKGHGFTNIIIRGRDSNFKFAEAFFYFTVFKLYKNENAKKVQYCLIFPFSIFCNSVFAS